MAVSDGDLLRIAARFKRSSNDDVVNVYGARISVSGTTPTNAQVMTAVSNWLNEMYNPINQTLSNTLESFDYKVDRVALVGGKFETQETIGVSTWTITTDPAAAGQPLPPACSYLVNIKTTNPRSIGRKYLGPPTEDHQSAGIVGSAQLAILADWATAYLAGYAVITGSDIVPAILSTKAVVSGAYDVLEAVISPVIAYMRSRKTGVGA